MTETPPVDLSYLRAITGGSAEMEKELFDMYFLCAESCLEKLALLAGAPEAEEWNDAVHAFKGASANLGAHGMVDLCRQAMQEATADGQGALLRRMREEYGRVRAFLLTG